MKYRQDKVKIIQIVKIPSDFIENYLVIAWNNSKHFFVRVNWNSNEQHVSHVGYLAISGTDIRPDIAYGSIIPSYIAIIDNFSRGSFTKGLNDSIISGGNERPRSQENRLLVDLTIRKCEISIL